MAVGSLADFLTAAWNDYRSKNPGANQNEWYQNNIVNLQNYYNTLAKQPQAAPAPSAAPPPAGSTSTAIPGYKYSAYGFGSNVSQEEANQKAILYSQQSQGKDLTAANVPDAGSGVPKNVKLDPVGERAWYDEQVRATKAQEEAARQQLAFNKGVSTGKVDGQNTMESTKYANELLANPRNAALDEQVRKGYALGDQPGQTVATYLNRSVDNLPKQIAPTPVVPKLHGGPVEIPGGEMGLAEALQALDKAGLHSAAEVQNDSRYKAAYGDKDVGSLEGNTAGSRAWNTPAPPRVSETSSIVHDPTQGPPAPPRGGSQAGFDAHQRREEQDANAADASRAALRPNDYTNDVAAQNAARVATGNAEKQLDDAARAAAGPEPVRPSGVNPNTYGADIANFDNTYKAWQDKYNYIRNLQRLQQMKLAQATVAPVATSTPVPPRIAGGTVEIPGRDTGGDVGLAPEDAYGGLGGAYNEWLQSQSARSGGQVPKDAAQRFSTALSTIAAIKRSGSKLQSELALSPEERPDFKNDPEARQRLLSFYRIMGGEEKEKNFDKIISEVQNMGLSDSESESSPGHSELEVTFASYKPQWLQDFHNPMSKGVNPDAQIAKFQIKGSDAPPSSKSESSSGGDGGGGYGLDPSLGDGDFHSLRSTLGSEATRNAAGLAVGGPGYAAYMARRPINDLAHNSTVQRYAKDAVFGPIADPAVQSGLKKVGGWITGNAGGGAVTVGGQPHWIVDNDGRPVAALTEDNKPEMIKGKAGVEVIPLDPARKAAYESRKKNVPGLLDGGRVGHNAAGQRGAPSRRPGKNAGDSTRTQSGSRATLSDGSIADTDPGVADGRSGNGRTNNGNRDALGADRGRHASDKDAKSVRPSPLSALAKKVQGKIEANGPTSVKITPGAPYMPNNPKGGQLGTPVTQKPVLGTTDTPSVPKPVTPTPGAVATPAPPMQAQPIAAPQPLPAPMQVQPVGAPQPLQAMPPPVQQAPQMQVQPIAPPQPIVGGAAGAYYGFDTPELAQEFAKTMGPAPAAPATPAAPAAPASAFRTAVDKYAQSPLANHAMRLASYIEGGSGDNASSWGHGDNGLAHGAFQVRQDAHPNYDVSKADDADYNANYMSNDYNQAAERVQKENPGLFESDPARASALTAFYAERPAQMYDESAYRTHYKNIGGALFGGTIIPGRATGGGLNFSAKDAALIRSRTAMSSPQRNTTQIGTAASIRPPRISQTSSTAIAPYNTVSAQPTGPVAPVAPTANIQPTAPPQPVSAAQAPLYNPRAMGQQGAARHTLISSGGARTIDNSVASAGFGSNADASLQAANANAVMGVKNNPGVFVNAAWKFDPRTLQRMNTADRAALESQISATGRDPATFYDQAKYAQPGDATSSRSFY